MQLIDLPNFIRRRILKRERSLFLSDIEYHHEQLSKAIESQSVLVIGGAGTIGSSFIKAVLLFHPRSLHVVDTNENGLTELTRDLRSAAGQYVPSVYKTYPMNFGDPVFRKMFLQDGPFDIVANFAAHKHVRSEKDQFSIEAMLDNNVFKAKAFLDFLLDHKPKHFFCVSTDKAANPVNVMGASKKLMEEVIMAYSNEIKITTARFANVAFSNGSLLDGYLQRLYKRQPLSCPSDVKRFFVSPEESGQICMLACILGSSGDIYFPKLFEEDLTKFKDITYAFLSDMGMEAVVFDSEAEAREQTFNTISQKKYPVHFFESDTSGEKMYEEFYTEEDMVDLDTYTSLGVVKNVKKASLSEIETCLSALQDLLNSPQYDKDSIVQLMQSIIPDFSHIETGKSLDQKM